MSSKLEVRQFLSAHPVEVDRRGCGLQADVSYLVGCWNAGYAYDFMPARLPQTTYCHGQPNGYEMAVMCQ